MLITVELKEYYIFTKIEKESFPPVFFKERYKMDIFLFDKWKIKIRNFTYDMYLIILKIDEKTGEIEMLSFDYYEFEDGMYREQQSFSWDEIEDIKIRKDVGFFEIDWTDELYINVLEVK